MKPLRVALFVKNTPAPLRRENRNMGYWSYPVPEFTWEHFPHDGGREDLSKFKDYDLIFHEDSGFCTYDNKQKGPPVVFLSIDSTLTDDHYQKRLAQGSQADLILVDHDRLERFNPSGKQIRRFAYCVNDLIFRPSELSIDVCFHCGAGESKGMPGGKERNQMRAMLGEYCQRRGRSFVSGSVGLEEYSRDMNSSRVVVNWPRTILNRSHRVFDTMASEAALLTGTLPFVDGDGIEDGTHYAEFKAVPDAMANLDEMLIEGCEKTAIKGHELVMSRHTWEIRAQELRQMLTEVFGL